jgi:hypothetical protein
MADLLALDLKMKLLSVYRNKTIGAAIHRWVQSAELIPRANKKSGHTSMGSECRADLTGKQKNDHTSVCSECRADPTGKQKERSYFDGLRVLISRANKSAAIPRWVQSAELISRANKKSGHTSVLREQSRSHGQTKRAAVPRWDQSAELIPRAKQACINEKQGHKSVGHSV